MVIPVSCDTLIGSFESVFHKLVSQSRAEANCWLLDNLSKLSGEEWDKYRATRQGELLHIQHVRSVMASLTGQKTNNHDHSKDEWYFLITIGRFTLGHTELVMEAFNEVVRDHYREEAHHPEYEEVTGVECGHIDILEMAIDRLSRNLQRNGSTYNWEQMEKFAPRFSGKFPGSDCKLKAYHTATREHADLAKDLWLRMTTRTPANSA